jgi:hypothetical protein
MSASSDIAIAGTGHSRAMICYSYLLWCGARSGPGLTAKSPSGGGCANLKL